MLVELYTEEHRRLVHQLRDEAEQWLADRGIDQYQVGPRAAAAHDAIDTAFDHGEFYGWQVGDRIVAVAALTSADKDFWTTEEAAQAAVYLARFMTAEHGQGYGAALLEALAEYARHAGYDRIRLDCWKSNTALQAYYLCRGFRHIRTIDVPGRMSGALFERQLEYPVPQKH